MRNIIYTILFVLFGFLWGAIVDFTCYYGLMWAAGVTTVAFGVAAIANSNINFD